MPLSSHWFAQYASDAPFDEMVSAGAVRKHYAGVLERFNQISPEEFERRKTLCDLSFRNQGVTFTLPSDPQGTERIFPFDVFPRVIPAQEWATLEKGLVQRVKALNAFMHDVYHDRLAIADRIVPADLVLGSPNFRREMQGVNLPHRAYTNIAGIDIVRDGEGVYRVLEDNLQIPSGVSYVLANRRVIARTFPHMLSQAKVRPVENYPDMLLETLRSLSPRDVPEPVVVLLTPGPYNSAYFEHVFLAQQMGVELVEGRDLFVDEGRVWMRTTRGRQQVDVIYRRIDDAFLDPTVFRPDSELGVPGLVRVYQEGRVAIANAIGAGVADSKALYAYVPELIRYYLNEAPILANVTTYLGRDPDHLQYILQNAPDLVIKKVDGAGGYGMLVGPKSSPQEISAYVDQVQQNPTQFVAQPTLQLSTVPTYAPDTARFEPRHVDLRPFVLTGQRIQVLPGGLTRVALRRGSLVVNSSQGGGSKDTWVLDG